ncbi:hypothetical protein KFK09_024366 [Dendrobium nobile]|uniref:Uncharacterized protein n=1 Tax=Dendrobium nobile TaxID=94219 RepID=A0A8T3ADV8_DENNO|nr:hypothetical protein KFK09_024366 [Dendrobium nobile]
MDILYFLPNSFTFHLRSIYHLKCKCSNSRLLLSNIFDFDNFLACKFNIYFSKFNTNGDVRSVAFLFKQLEEHDVIICDIIELGDMTVVNEPFSRTLVRDVKSWNSILLGYAKGVGIGACESCFTIIPDKNVFSWNGLIGGYARHGRWIHFYYENNEFRWNVYIFEGLIDMYNKCECMHSAINVFTTMKKRALDLSIRMEEDFLSYVLLYWAHLNEFVDMH